MSTFDTSKHQQQLQQTGNTGLINLLVKHGDNLRVSRTLKRSNFTADGKKKGFSILTNDMLNEIENESPEDTIVDETDADVSFSLFQGFSAVLPEVDETVQTIKAMSGKMLEGNGETGLHQVNLNLKGKKIKEITLEKIKQCQSQKILNSYKSEINYHLDLLEIRKGLGKCEIAEIDDKIDKLFIRRKEISDSITEYEKSETTLENQLHEIKNRLEFIKDIDMEIDNDVKLIPQNGENNENDNEKDQSSQRKQNEKKATNNKNSLDDDYVNIEIGEGKSYTRVTSSSKKHKSGDLIHQFQAHPDSINCLAMDEPYSRLITCSTDNTVRLWDMNRYKCIGLLEGHYSYVNCVEIDDHYAFTGSMDATVKMWDLNYFNNSSHCEFDGIEDVEEGHGSSLVHSYEGHVDKVTALSYHNGELVSGSDDKTIRQWDLTTGHLLQTIDVMWASSMANSTINFGENNLSGRRTNLGNNTEYPYISSLQVFDAALASGSNDGIVRLWDLRSGEVIRQLFGHTSAVTTLQFDKHFNLVTGSGDRSIRIWDLRTGGLLDSYTYESGIKKLKFDDKKIVSICESEPGIHVYERIEQKHSVFGESFVQDIDYSGNYLVSGGPDGMVNVHYL
ncbi:hypothetical protein CANINC_000696 [Pichia inconspicua]|uniref:Uncharacterized protein n=1 Tax=Pichia inconspicua TaxID=52247 RepID=A0A4V4NG67_9ASCO|nr:hypothetical protein CANINC_000696 [[Candida] inconspicua]